MTIHDDRDVSLVILGETPARRRRRPSLRLVVAALLVVALAAGGVAWWVMREPVPAGTAYELDGSATSAADLRREVATLRSMYGVEVPSGDEAIDRFWRDAAKASAVARVVERAAAELDVVVPEATARSAMDAYVTQMFGGGEDGRRAFVAELAEAGTSEPAVLTEIGRQLVVQQLYQRIVEEVGEPTDDAVRRAFADRGCTLTVPEARGLRNIVVTSREEAQDVADRLAAGEDFAALAAVRSADESSRSTGGDLGVLYRGQLDEAYGAAAFEAPQGGVFGPVESQFGWNVGQVTSVVPATQAAEADGLAAMRSLLGDEAKAERWSSWLRDRIREADLEYADRYRPADPDALPDSVAGTDADDGEERTCPTLTTSPAAGAP